MGRPFLIQSSRRIEIIRRMISGKLSSLNKTAVDLAFLIYRPLQTKTELPALYCNSKGDAQIKRVPAIRGD